MGHKTRLLIDREDGDQLLYFTLILFLWKLRKKVLCGVLFFFSLSLSSCIMLRILDVIVLTFLLVNCKCVNGVGNLCINSLSFLYSCAAESCASQVSSWMIL